MLFWLYVNTSSFRPLSVFWSWVWAHSAMLAVDEAPLTCEAFIEEGGMQIFLRVLEVCAINCG